MSDSYIRWPSYLPSLIPSATTGHLLAAAPATYNIGATASQSGPDFRYSKAFLKDSLIVGSFDGTPPYALNNPFVTGMVGAGSLSNTSVLVGANNTFFAATAMGFMVFNKDGGATNAPGFFNGNTALDLDVYFGVAHQTSARQDYVKFGADGTLSLLAATGANLLWGTDGTGTIGNPTTSRPNYLYTQQACYAGSSAIFQINDIWFPEDGGVHGFIASSLDDALVSIHTVDAQDGHCAKLQFSDGVIEWGWRARPALRPGVIELFSDTPGDGELPKLSFDCSNLTTVNILWDVDGGGNIGAAGANRPGNIFASGNLRLGGNLGVGNSAAATTLGTVVKKIEIFDAAGVSLGFIPVYDSIT